VLHQCGVQLLTLNFSKNRGVTAFGAARIRAAVRARGNGQQPAIVDFAGCDNLWNGPALDELSALVADLRARNQAFPGAAAGVTLFTLVLPPRPLPRFNVAGHFLSLDDFQPTGVGSFLPYVVPVPVGSPPLTLHREDLNMSESSDYPVEKAKQLAAFLDAVSKRQSTNPHALRGGCPSHFLAHVYHVSQRDYMVSVVIEDFDPRDSYSAMLAKFSPPPKVKYEIFHQICAGVKFFHEYKVVLREMRPDQLIVMRITGGTAHCRYIDYSPIRTEEMRTKQVVVGGAIAFSDSAMVNSDKVSRKWDLFAVAMMIVYAYRFTTDEAEFRSKSQYKWLKPALQPVEEQLEPAKAFYEKLGLPPPVADIVVQLSRIDADNRMSLADAAERFAKMADNEPEVS